MEGAFRSLCNVHPTPPPPPTLAHSDHIPDDDTLGLVSTTGYFDVAAFATATGLGGVDGTIGGRTLEPALALGAAQVEGRAVRAAGLARSHAASDAGGNVDGGEAESRDPGLAVPAFDEAPASLAATAAGAVTFDEAAVAKIRIPSTHLHRRPVAPRFLQPALPLTDASVEGRTGDVAVAGLEAAAQLLVRSDCGKIECSHPRFAGLPTPQLPAPTIETWF